MLVGVWVWFAGETGAGPLSCIFVEDYGLRNTDTLNRGGARQDISVSAKGVFDSPVTGDRRKALTRKVLGGQCR